MKLLFLMFLIINLKNQLKLENKYYNVVDIETGESIKMHPKQIKDKYVQREKLELLKFIIC